MGHRTAKRRNGDTTDHFEHVDRALTTFCGCPASSCEYSGRIGPAGEAYGTCVCFRLAFLSIPVNVANLVLPAVKVHYSFDRDNQVHCLARWPNILHIQTIPLDEKTTIGVVDLRTCLQAVSQSSP